MARQTLRRAAVDTRMRTKGQSALILPRVPDLILPSGYTAAECRKDMRQLLAAIIEFLLREHPGD